MEEEREKKLVGRVTHYFNKIGVAVVDLEDTLNEGDEILIEGKNTHFTQKVESMQIEHKPVKTATAGQSIGLKVNERVREKDLVYKLL